MDEPDSATRVEIELTTNDDSRMRRRRSSVATAELVTHGHGYETRDAAPELEAQLPPESGPPPTTIERRKLIVGAVAVATVALFVGWALGRAGGSSASQEAQPQATTGDSSPSETPPLAEIPTTITVTTRPVVRAGPATTTVPEWETSIVEVDPAAAALDVKVVLIGGGRIAEVDTGSGDMQTLGTRETFQQPPLVNAGADWMVIRNFDSGGSQLVRDGELPVHVSIGDPWSTHFQPTTGLFWKMPNNYGMGDGMVVTEVDHEGQETGRRIELPSNVWPAAADPAGGVLASAPGGTYSIDVDGVRRVTSGNLVALNERIAVMTQCGDDFSTCGLFVVDRASGQQTPVDVVFPESAGGDDILDLQNPGFWGYPGLLATISPDDRWAPVLITNDAQQFGLIDLVTGQLELLGANPPSGFWWSPDGRFALYNANGRLMLFDTADGSRTDALPSEGGVQAFAVRPSV